MTVDELRAALAGLPGDMPVILVGEGGAYSPAAGVTVAKYLATSTWEGERYEQDEAAPDGAHQAAYIAATW
ncbi:hypothetical protein ABT299_44950 [Spirillospora sp. NPDC000708]